MNAQSLALLKILQAALVTTRNLGMDIAHGKGDLRQLWALGEATHNIPYLIENPDKLDEERLLRDLTTYDRKWPSGPRLKELYLEAIRPKPRTVGDELRDFHNTPPSAHTLIQKLGAKLVDLRCKSCGAHVGVELHD